MSASGAFASASDLLSGSSGLSSLNTLVSSPMYNNGSVSRRSSSFSFSTKPIIFCKSFLISCLPASSNSRQASLHKFSTSASFTSMKKDSDKNNGFREILSAPALSSPSSMEKNNEIVLSGIRPTGFLHLGNYFGALKNWARMQYEYKCFFFIADWHSLTTHTDTSELAQNTRRLVAELIAGGLDPEKCTMYAQSDIPEIPELYLYLNMLAYQGELEKTVTFKEKARRQPENINAGLLTYPVLQAADILIHRSHYVPVGKDQEQHIEMTRNFAERFNYRYGEVFPVPKAFSYSN